MVSDLQDATATMWEFVERAYPLCRSITGDGVRQTLGMIAEHAPLEIHEVPSGTPVLDWIVPREWNLREAWLKDPAGRTVVDSRDHNLHVLGYSAPVHRKVKLEELEGHLFSLPDKPDLIPYRTSFYNETWGFCLPHRQRAALPSGVYEVFIDSSLEEGSLTYGETYLPGRSEDEIFVSCHVCHPSLANDNLSGMAVAMALAAILAKREQLRYSYRLVFVPGTIGALTWLARNEGTAHRVRHGLVAANLGDSGSFHYKRSRRGSAEIDRAVAKVLADSGRPHDISDFVPFGYDERQYGSPGFDLPVGSLTRTPWGRYPEYHTSADNLNFISERCLAESLAAYLEVFELLEGNLTYVNLHPRGEPQLGRRGLYRSIGGDDAGREQEMALLWVLNLSDGQHSLLDISERSALPFHRIRRAATDLLAAELLEEISRDGSSS